MDKFCDKCSNIFKIRNIENENKLQYYCRNCDNTLDYDEDNYCVYSNKMNKDFNIYNIVNNPYISKDPTLPILNNIQCINEKCIINNYIDNSYIVYESDDKIINIIIEKLNIKVETKKLENKYLIIFNTKENMINNEKKLKDICKQKKIDIEINNIKENKVKSKLYDTDDMVYIYICIHCNTSWENI